MNNKTDADPYVSPIRVVGTRYYSHGGECIGIYTLRGGLPCLSTEALRTLNKQRYEHAKDGPS